MLLVFNISAFINLFLTCFDKDWMKIDLTDISSNNCKNHHFIKLI